MEVNELFYYKKYKTIMAIKEAHLYSALLINDTFSIA